MAQEQKNEKPDFPDPKLNRVYQTLVHFSRDNPYYFEGGKLLKHPPLTVFNKYSPAKKEAKGEDVVGVEEVFEFFKRHEKDETVSKLKSSAFMTCKLLKWREYIGNFPPGQDKKADWFFNEILVENVRILTLDRCLLSIKANEFFPTLCKMKNLVELTFQGTYFQLREHNKDKPTLSEVSPIPHLSVIEVNCKYWDEHRMWKHFFPWKVLLWACPNLETLIVSYSSEKNRKFAFHQFHYMMVAIKAIKSKDATRLGKLKNVIFKYRGSNPEESGLPLTENQYYIARLLIALSLEFEARDPPRVLHEIKPSNPSLPNNPFNDKLLWIESLDISVSFETKGSNASPCILNMRNPIISKAFPQLCVNTKFAETHKTEETKTFDENVNLNQDCTPTQHDGPEPLPIYHYDILPKICNFLTCKDLKSFRLVCKQWKDMSFSHWKECVTRSMLARVCRKMRNLQNYWDVPVQHATLTVFSDYAPPDTEEREDVIGATELYKFFKSRNDEDITELKKCFRSCKLKNWEYFGNFPKADKEKYLGAIWLLNEMAENVITLTLEECCLSGNAMEFFPTLCKFRNLETLVLTKSLFKLDPGTPEPTPSEVVSPLPWLKSLQINYEDLDKDSLPNYFFPWEVLLSCMPDVNVVVMTHSTDVCGIVLDEYHEMTTKSYEIKKGSGNQNKCDIQKALMKATEDPDCEFRYPHVNAPGSWHLADSKDLWCVPFF